MKQTLTDHNQAKLEDTWLQHWKVQLGQPSCTPGKMLRAFLENMDVWLDDLDNQMCWGCWPSDDDIKDFLEFTQEWLGSDLLDISTTSLSVLVCSAHAPPGDLTPVEFLDSARIPSVNLQSGVVMDDPLVSTLVVMLTSTTATAFTDLDVVNDHVPITPPVEPHPIIPPAEHLPLLLPAEPPPMEVLVDPLQTIDQRQRSRW
jgi:hypothetical protein